MDGLNSVLMTDQQRSVEANYSLRALTLPAIDDVREGLRSYRKTSTRADELNEKIDRTDDLIDEIVYELYGLTDEEIEIVEEAVEK